MARTDIGWRRSVSTMAVLAMVTFLAAGCPWDSQPAADPPGAGPATNQPATTPAPNPPPPTAQPPTAAASMTGTWVGSWRNLTPDDSTGTFTVVWTQQGDKLSGSITITGTPCLDGGSVTGTLSGQQISFGAVRGQVTVAYTGTVAGSSMSGSYSTGCGNAQGNWTATKQ